MSRSPHIVTLVLTLIMIVACGTAFFRWAEGWSWLDAYFFTVVTLSTVGYGNLVPVTALGKIGTTVFIFVGLGVFAVAIQQFGFFAIRRREEVRRKRREHGTWTLGNLAGQSDQANEDHKPDPDPDVSSKPHR